MLADPGIKYQDDTVTLNGKDYPAIKARFNPGVGDADKDIYKMVIDPKTSIVKFANKAADRIVSIPLDA